MAVRILPLNFLDGTTSYSASSQSPYIVGGVDFRQLGSASVQGGGTYTGAFDVVYRIEIESTPAGGGIIGSFFRWSDSGGVSWNATGVPATAYTFTTLNNGVQWKWSFGSTQPHMVAGDYWSLPIFRPYGLINLLDYNRNREFRTDVVTNGQVVTLTYGFAAPKVIQGLVIGDPNWPAGTTMQMQSSNASNFTGLTQNVSVPVTPGQSFYYLPAAYTASSYTRLQITAGAAASYLRISDLYLGSVITMSREFSIGFPDGYQRLGSLDAAALMRGAVPLGLMAPFREVSFNLRSAATGQDVALLRSVWLLLHDQTTWTKRPCWFIQDTVQPFMFDLMHWNDLQYAQHHRFLERYDVTMKLLGVTRTVA